MLNLQRGTVTKRSKQWISLLLCLALTALPSAALAEETEPAATPQTGELTFELPEEKAQYAYRLSDGEVVSRISFKAEEAFSFTFEPSKQGVLLKQCVLFQLLSLCYE